MQQRVNEAKVISDVQHKTKYKSKFNLNSSEKNKNKKKILM